MLVPTLPVWWLRANHLTYLIFFNVSSFIRSSIVAFFFPYSTLPMYFLKRGFQSWYSPYVWSPVRQAQRIPFVLELRSCSSQSKSFVILFFFLSFIFLAATWHLISPLLLLSTIFLHFLLSKDWISSENSLLDSVCCVKAKLLKS